MRRWWLVVVGLVVSWLQIGLLSAWRPWGVVPDLVIVTIIWACKRLTAIESLGLAAGLGLWLDLTSGTDFGLRVAFLIMLVLALLVVRQLGADVDAWSLGLALVLGATIVFNLTVLATLVIAHVPLPGFGVALTVFKECSLNLLLALLAGPLFDRLWPETGTLVISGAARG